MSRIVAIGEAAELGGYGLAGADVVDAPGPEDVRRAWEALGADVALVLLTPDARAALPESVHADRMLWAVLPE
jgi:vacuolar-type H+-ATPase subunit F/Vma7